MASRNITHEPPRIPPHPANGTIVPASSPLSPAPATLAPTFTPIDMLRLAVSQNADLDKLIKIQEFVERHEAHEARKAYDAAMSDFKTDAPVVLKNKHVDDPSKGSKGYDHATLDHACEVLIPELAKHGFTHRWKMEQSTDREWITVTCVIRHRFGHFEETTLSGAPDRTGSKNSVQAISSTVSYLERITFLGACGLAAKGTDSDGRGAAAPASEGIAADRVDWHLTESERAQSTDHLRTVFQAAYAEAEVKGDRPAQGRYIDAKNARYRALVAVRRGGAR
jgi:hypothetical protein